MYLQLQKCFAALGRGNRPKPPTGLPLTNRLLLQLRRLQDESGKTSNAVSNFLKMNINKFCTFYFYFLFVLFLFLFDAVFYFFNLQCCSVVTEAVMVL